MKRLLSITLMAFSASATYAQNSSSAAASLGALTVVLADLNTSDGIAPPITWGQSIFGQYERDAYVSNGVVFGNDAGYPASRNSLASNLSASLPRLVATNAGNFGAQNTSASFTQGAVRGGGIAVTDFYVDPANRSNSSTDYFGSNYTFTLSANTRVTFSAQASVTAQTFVGPSDPVYGNNSAGAIASISVGQITASSGSYPYYFTSQGGGIDSGRAQISVSVFSPFLLSASDSRLLSISYSNTTNSAQTAYFWDGTQAYANANALAVPEPASSAMMLAGMLGLAGRLLYRRKSIDV